MRMEKSFALLVFLAVLAAAPVQAAPGDVLFSDDFESGNLSNDWQVMTSGPPFDRGEAGVNGDTSNSGNFSMFTRHGEVSVRLRRTIDLSAVAGAEFEFWLRRGDDAFSDNPEDGEDMEVEYQNADGDWIRLDTAPGDDTFADRAPGEILHQRFQLPAAALHSDFRFRFRQTGGTGEDLDYWHVDDVVLTETLDPGAGSGPGFCEDFEGDLTRWSVSDAQRAGTGVHTAASGSRSLFLRWRTVTATSREIDLSGGAPAEVTAWLRRGDDAFSENPEDGEDLSIEYLDDGGTWRTLETFTGDGTQGEVFDRSYPLKANALHSGFRVRLRLPNDDGPDFDYWHVDELCVRKVAPLLEYRMDEAGWSGDDSVLDASGNNRPGTPVGGAAPDDADPARDTNPGTCGYGTFNDDSGDSGQGVEDANAGSYLNGLSAVTVTAWVYNTDSLSNNNRGIFATRDADSKDNGFGLRYDREGFNTPDNIDDEDLLKASLNTTECSDGTDCIQVETEPNQMVRNTWQHVALTWESGGDLRVYVDGDDVTGDNTGDIGQGTGGTLDEVDGLRIAQSGLNASQRWQGRIDEFRVYGAALTKAQVRQVFRDTRPCPAEEVDGYRIDVGGGNASTCAARPITITAEDSSGNAVTDYSESVDITTSSGHGTWTKNDADGPLNGVTADDGAAGYDFVTSDAGTIDLDLANQHADDLTITVSESDGAPSSTSSIVSFRHNAFVIEPRSALANKANDDLVAGLDQPFQATLVRRDPPTPAGQCGIATNYDESNQDVALWVERNGDDPGGNAPQVNGTGLPNGAPGSANVTLDFSSNTLSQAGRAPFDLATSDLGKYALMIEDTTFAEDEAGNPRPITGGTPDYVVRPFGLRLTANGNPAAVNAAGPDYRVAATDFDVTVAGVVYDSADDDGDENGTADDGVPDGHTDADASAEANLSDNAVTPSFGQEGTNETAEVTSALVAPSGEGSPPLDGEPVTFTDFAGDADGDGAATQPTSWPEVGIIELAATVTNYLGSGRSLEGRSGEVGRFIPADFNQTATHGAFENECNATFTYIGEAFGYATGMVPELNITARNDDGATTKNYTGSFAKLSPSDIDRGAPMTDDSQNGDDGTLLPVTPQVSEGKLTDNNDGTLTYTFDDTDTFTFERNIDRDDDGRIDAQIEPFDASLTITIDAIKDSDNVAAPVANREDVTPTPTTELRYGRIRLDNVYGPENLNLTLPLRAEYWKGGRFRLNTADGCFQYNPWSESEGGDVRIISSDVAENPRTENPGNFPAVQEYGLEAGEPKEGNEILVRSARDPVDPDDRQSEVELLNVPDWLKPIDSDGNLQNPSATATFGVYRGHDRIIYWREVE